jgi:pimeloyl-ACP methyl ester carboxylesterase
MLKQAISIAIGFGAFAAMQPVQARFLQSDPIGLHGGPSTYAYVSNSPLNRIDPNGLRDIFVGGAGDASSGIVQSYYAQYHQTNPDSAYYSWEDLNAILQDIASAAPNDPINLIGHSYGGDTAATAARKTCRKVNLLITIDPVSHFHNFDMQAIANAVNTWVDVDAEGNNPFQWSNLISGLGGAWDNDPAGVANLYIQDNGVNHEDFRSMMNAAGPGTNSPANILSGAPLATSSFTQ